MPWIIPQMWLCGLISFHSWDDNKITYEKVTMWSQRGPLVRTGVKRPINGLLGFSPHYKWKIITLFVADGGAHLVRICWAS